MGVGSWLRNLGLEQYTATFEENGVDFSLLPMLTNEDLKDLGVTRLADRKTILKAIAEIELASDVEVSVPLVGEDKPVLFAPGGERRQLTVMFVDMVGSTALSARLDPEDLHEIIRRYQNLVAGEAARYEGHVAKFMGDGVLIYFGFPIAHEEDAERAVRAARSIITALDREIIAGERLEVRIGAATGEVVVGDLVGEGMAKEESVVGETPNLAARLQQLAPPGSVVISPATRALLGNLFKLEDLGERELEGFAAPLRCWRVLGERMAESRFEAAHAGRLSRLVGREQELALLEERWSRALQGEGQAVLLTGEAGIGKSRLTQALMKRLASTAYTRLQYQCSPYHVNSALHPFIAQIDRAAGFSPDEDVRSKLSKLEALLCRASDDVDHAVELIGSLLSLETGDGMMEHEPDRKKRKRRTFNALLEQLAGLAARQPVLVIFEDSHLADPTSLELLEEMVDHLQDKRVLAVITGRPEFRPTWPGHMHVTKLTLNRLSRHQGAEIVKHLAGGKALPETVFEQIVARTDGVPLFVEELTKTVLESGFLHDTGDRFVLKGELPSTTIPSTLQDSLMARLDRLAPVKEVAQMGAAIGREFSHHLIAMVSELSEQKLTDALDQLVGAELVIRRGNPPDAIYTFKHALVQDTAYATLLRAKRQAIHMRIADALMVESRDRVEAEPEVLAHHYTEGRMPERATPYWIRAGKQAAERSADLEAREHLRMALKLIGELPRDTERDRRELEALIVLGPVLTNLEGSASPQVRTAYSRARKLCDEVGEPAQRFPVLWGLWIHYNMAGASTTALELAQEALALAESLGDEDFLIQAHHAAWTTQQGRGNFGAVIQHADQALSIYDVEKHRTHAFTYGGHDPGICAAIQSAIAIWFLGYPDQARERAERALRLAPAVAHGFSTAHALAFVATVCLFRREPEQAIPFLDQLITFSESHRLGLWQANGRVLRSWALAEVGRAGEVIDDFREGIQERLASGSRLRLPLQLAALANAIATTGDTNEAEVVIGQALNEMEKTGERTWETYVHWVKGRILSAKPKADVSRVAACFQEVSEIARRQGAKSMELRAATRLAALWSSQGRMDEARRLLRPLYEWFTEGFDTPDLKDARNLLEQLS